MLVPRLETSLYFYQPLGVRTSRTWKLHHWNEPEVGTAVPQVMSLVKSVIFTLLLCLIAPQVSAQVQASPAQLSFAAVSGGDAPPPQPVVVMPGSQGPGAFTVVIAGQNSSDPAPSWLKVNQANGTSPGILMVSVDQSGLTAAGTPYTASLQISDAHGSTAVPVTLTVNSGPASLSVVPQGLHFEARVQSPGIIEQAFVIDNNGGGGALTFTAAITGQSPWITGVIPSFGSSAPPGVASGQVVPNSPAIVRVRVNTQGLAVGSYHDAIAIASPAGSATVPITLFVSDQGSIMSLSDTGFRFFSRQGAGSVTARTVIVNNVGDPGSTITWTADLPFGSNWLNLGPSTGTSSATNPGTLTLSPNASAASATSPSYALVRISDPNALNSPQYVVAVLDSEPVAVAPVAEVIPGGLLFTTAAGAPPPQTVNIYTSSDPAVPVQIAAATSDGANWLSANLTSSRATTSAPAQISVSVSSAGLAPGAYNGTVSVNAGGAVQAVNVSLIVVPAGCTPHSLVMTQSGVVNNFSAPAGWPVQLSVQLTDDCGSPITNASVIASFSTGDTPLALSGDQRTGGYSATWQPGSTPSPVVITTRATAPCCGSVTGQLVGTITANPAAPPSLIPNGLLHIFFNVADATALGAGLAPGNVAQIYGAGFASTSSGTSVPLPTQFNGTSMLVGSLSAPLFYVSGTMLDVQIPSELTANREYAAVVGLNGAFTLPQKLTVVPVQPGVAEYPDQSVIAQHSDYTLITSTSPAKPGETVIIYLAGMGAAATSVPSGTPTPGEAIPTLVQPTVQLGGENAAVAYAGLTPQGIGLYQINFTVPADAASGSLNLTIIQNGVASNTTTLPVAGSTPLQVLTLTPNPLNLTNAPGALTITLSSPAGSAGQIVNLASSNPNVATVTPSITIPPGTVSANVTVTAGNATGSTVVTASASGFASGSATVNVAAAGQPSIAVVSGNQQSTAVNTAYQNPLAVIVKDGNGNPMSGIAVTFSAPASGPSGTFSGTSTNTATTNASGVATSAVITANGTLGSFTVTASAPSITAPATFSLTNTSGAGSIVATGGTPQSTLINTAFASPLAVTVKDGSNNPMSGVVVTFTTPSSGAGGSFAGGANTATTNAAGVATSATFTANGTVGNYVVSASATGIPTSATFSLTNTAAAPASIAATGGTPQSAAVNSPFALPLVAMVKDSSGNPISGAVVVFRAPATGASGTFAGGISAATTDASGTATSAAFIAGNTAGSYTVTASVAGVSTPASFSLTNTAGTAASISAAAGTPQSTPVNSAFPTALQVIVKDGSGNPVSGVTVAFAAPSSGASGTFLGGAITQITNSSGTATAVPFTANGTVGSYSVTASAPGVGVPAVFALTNSAGAASGTLAVSLPATVGQSLQVSGTVQIPQAAPAGGVSITLSTSDPSKLLLAVGATDNGANSISVSILQGATTAKFFVHGASASGSATVTAGASGYSSGTAPVGLSASGFVISGPGGFTSSTVSTSPGVSTALTITAAQLDSSLHFVQAQSVAGGVTASVSVTSSTPSVGTITQSPAAFSGGASTATVQFNAVAVGATSISINVPSGFSAPSQNTSLTASVAASGLTASSVSVGRGLETFASVALNAVASSQVPITISSNNPSLLLLAVNATDAGASSITINVQAGSQGAQFWVYGLGSSGSVTYVASAQGFGAIAGTVNLSPSGFVITSGSSSSFTTSVAQGSQLITVSAARLNSSSNFVETMPLAGGPSVSVNVTSSNPGVGTIAPAAVTIAPGTINATTLFKPLSAGSTTLTVSTPAGFTAPASSPNLPGSTVTANVVAASLSLADPGLVGQNLAGQGVLSLTQAAPPGGTVVTLTSNDPRLLLSATGTDKGSASINVTVPGGTSQGSYFVYSLASSGTATYTASAPGFTSRTSSVTLSPSGAVAQGTLEAGGQQFIQATVAGGAVTVSPVVMMGVLDAGGNFLGPQQLAGTVSVTVSLTSGTPAVGTITPSVTIPPGAMSADAVFTPITAGKTVITLSTPSGFSTVANNTITAIVQ